MLTLQSKSLSLTLVTYITLALALSSVAQADVTHDLNNRGLGQHRMLRKRQDGSLGTLLGVGSDPATASISSSSSAGTTPTQTTAGGSATTSASSTGAGSVTTSSTSNTATSSTSNTSNTSSSTTATTSSSGTSTTSTSSSSSVPTSTSSTSSLSSTPSKAPAAVTTPEPSVGPATAHSTVHVTKTDGGDSSVQTAASNQASAASSGKVAKTTVTILIAIAASVGGVAIIWTIIRKWKFKPSSQFEDRMAPIDWNPSEDGAGGLGVPGNHRRAPSAASSFHSGSAHGQDENMAGRGMGGGYGATSNDGHGPLPDHDFTAGPSANLAPVGGYADLARGPSPGPQMGEVNYDYGMHGQRGGVYQPNPYVDGPQY